MLTKLLVWLQVMPVLGRLFFLAIITVMAGALLFSVLPGGHDGIGALVGLAAWVGLLIWKRALIFAPRR